MRSEGPAKLPSTPWPKANSRPHEEAQCSIERCICRSVQMWGSGIDFAIEFRFLDNAILLRRAREPLRSYGFRQAAVREHGTCLCVFDQNSVPMIALSLTLLPNIDELQIMPNFLRTLLRDNKISCEDLNKKLFANDESTEQKGLGDQLFGKVPMIEVMNTITCRLTFSNFLLASQPRSPRFRCA